MTTPCAAKDARTRGREDARMRGREDARMRGREDAPVWPHCVLTSL